ncbi:MAG: hypothetical protein ABSF69_29535 [Polyangiaceae bacterium]|jgi:hypothetical protein
MTSAYGGQFELQYAPSLTGPYTTWPGSGVKDTYSKSTDITYPVFEFGFSTAGFTIGSPVYFKVLVKGQNEDSKGHLLYLDYLDVVFEEPDCDRPSCQNCKVNGH